MSGGTRKPVRLACLAIALLALLAGACSKTPPAASDWTGPWRASLQLPGGELVFGLEIQMQEGAPIAWLVNGQERIAVPEVRIDGDGIVLQMPGFEHTITATRHDTTLTGELLMIKAKGAHQRIAFSARHGEPARFFADEAAAIADVSGRWAATFTDDEGDTYPAVGEFTQQGDQVSGTFLTPTGDYRYLNGELRDNVLHLATFNGGHAFLFRATLGDDGSTLAGDYWSGLAWHETFVARRDEAASLGDTGNVTTMKQPGSRLDVSFPDLQGTRVSLADERFAGKVIIVALGGSWCPNCHDEAAYLAQYYREHRDKGLEIVGLMFEQREDQAEAVVAVQRFRDRHDIGFPLLLAGIRDRTDAAEKLPQLNGVFAYPTTLFIDRRGVVRHIHTGFSGPATGRHYNDLTRDFEQRIQSLLAEQP